MIEARKYIFTVSLCAMLAVNPVLADKVENPTDLGTSHDVYVESTIDMAESGIAGVQYVNRMVGVAGAAAQKAEDHAASAGGSAYNAAESAKNAQTAADNAADDAAKAAASAKAANEALDKKLDKSLGADKKNLAMVTDDKGTVYPGYISTDMIAPSAVTNDKIADGAVSTDKIDDLAVSTDKIGQGAVKAGKIYAMTGIESFAGLPLVKDNVDSLAWGQVGTAGIADKAVTWDKIAEGAVSESKMYSSGQAAGVALLADGNAGAEWGQVGSAGIADAAVTWDKIAPFAVGSGQITDGAIISDKIAGDAVTSDKIADGAVTVEKIGSDVSQTGILVANGNGGAEWTVVGTTGIHDGAVTTDKMSADGAASAGHTLVAASGSYGFYVTWGQVGTEGIADDAVTRDKIALFAVGSGQIDMNAIITDKIADGAVTREKTDGIVGVIPVGSATNPTSYGSFWIE